MSWNLDVPELPFKKPKMIEELESIDFDQREAMDPQERKDRVRETAYSLAKSYKNHIKDKGSFEGCVAITTEALSSLGNSLSGKLGTQMVGESERVAQDACRIVYPEEE